MMGHVLQSRLKRIRPNGSLSWLMNFQRVFNIFANIVICESNYLFRSTIRNSESFPRLWSNFWRNVNDSCRGPFWPISCSVYINEQSSANSHSCIGCRPVACGIVMGKGFEYNWFTLWNRSYNFDSQSAVTCWLSANINSQLSLRAISNRFLVLYFYHYRVSRLHLYCSADLADLQNLGCLSVTQWVYCMEYSCKPRIFASPSALQKVDGKCIAGN